MLRQVTCECGYLARGETDDEVVTITRKHIAQDHPQLVDSVTNDRILSWIEIVAP
jgi:predicted small metal-binding protein